MEVILQSGFRAYTNQFEKCSSLADLPGCGHLWFIKAAGKKFLVQSKWHLSVDKYESLTVIPTSVLV